MIYAESTETKEKASPRERIITHALELGFAFCNFADARITFDPEVLANWYSEGYAADMEWLKNNMDKRQVPGSIFEVAKTIVVCGLNYYQNRESLNPGYALYAQGRDYHKVMKKKLKALSKFMEEEFAAQNRFFTDTAPVLERPIAREAGAGWQGKSSLLVNKRCGKYFFLGEIFTTLDLEPDSPHADLCGECTRCMDSCPTGAIVAPYRVDARRCLSYLTIENKESIPVQFRKALGHRLYGCDECSAACPWNRFAQATNEEDFQARKFPTALEVLGMGEEEFGEIFAGTPIHRVGLENLRRNACVVVGNICGVEALPILRGMAEGESGKVREHALWAIEEIEGREGL